MSHYDNCREGYCALCGQGSDTCCSSPDCPNVELFIKVAPDNANTIQIGGDHYKTEYEHWDFVENNGLGYLEAAATKYVTRWRHKNGIQDLEKALHYTEKLMELHRRGKRLPRGVAPMENITRFCTFNKLDSTECMVIQHLSSWCRLDDLERATLLIKMLMQEARDATGN